MVLQRDFTALCQGSADFDRDTIKCEDVSRYATNFTSTLFNLAKMCIPNKTVKV